MVSANQHALYILINDRKRVDIFCNQIIIPQTFWEKWSKGTNSTYGKISKLQLLPSSANFSYLHKNEVIENGDKGEVSLPYYL